MAHLGNVTLLANPAAQNGNGMKHAQHAYELLKGKLGEDNVSLVLTARPKQAVDLASQLGGLCDTLVVLGGDGIIHEAVNGLMRIPREERPLLGLLPAGSGNDYAKSLGISFKVPQALNQLLEGTERVVDVGLCNGEYFTETLSFGLDAAIALDTMDRRKKTGAKGTRLYLEAGLNQLLNHLDTHSFEFEYVDSQGVAHRREGKSHIFAIQNGPTYGGGFKVAPDARLEDGLLDVCIAHAPLSVAKATGIFLLAKEGKHTGFKCIESFRCSSMKVKFSAAPPSQIDGEQLEGCEFDVSVQHEALRVVIA